MGLCPMFTIPFGRPSFCYAANFPLAEILPKHEQQRTARQDAIQNACGKHEYHQRKRNNTVADAKNQPPQAVFEHDVYKRQPSPA